MLERLTILDLTPAQLAAAEQHFWATESEGSGTIYKAERVADATGPFPYAAGIGKGRRVVAICRDAVEAETTCDVHNRSILLLVRTAIL